MEAWDPYVVHKRTCKTKAFPCSCQLEIELQLHLRTARKHRKERSSRIHELVSTEASKKEQSCGYVNQKTDTVRGQQENACGEITVVDKSAHRNILIQQGVEVDFVNAEVISEAKRWNYHTRQCNKHQAFPCSCLKRHQAELLLHWEKKIRPQKKIRLTEEAPSPINRPSTWYL